MKRDWRDQHGKVIVDFVSFLNEKTDRFILKGDTALYLCNALDRFSEDIDLDGREKGIPDLVHDFCEKSGYDYRIAKHTNTVERCMVHYGNKEKPLKIEASFRRREIDPSETQIINGILVYGIEELCMMKINAYTGRDRIRDLYDVTFIYKQYYEQLSPQTIALLRDAIAYKGIEQLDYIINDQEDELINASKLTEDFLEMYDRLGLL